MDPSFFLMDPEWVCDEPQQSFSRGCSQLIPPPAQALGFALQVMSCKGKDSPQSPAAELLFWERFPAQMRALWEAEGAATLLPCALTQLLSWGCLEDALLADSLVRSPLFRALWVPGAPCCVSSTSGRQRLFLNHILCLSQPHSTWIWH